MPGPIRATEQPEGIAHRVTPTDLPTTRARRAFSPRRPHTHLYLSALNDHPSLPSTGTGHDRPTTQHPPPTRPLGPTTPPSPAHERAKANRLLAPTSPRPCPPPALATPTPQNPPAPLTPARRPRPRHRLAYGTSALIDYPTLAIPKQHHSTGLPQSDRGGPHRHSSARLRLPSPPLPCPSAPTTQPTGFARQPWAPRRGSPSARPPQGRAHRRISPSASRNSAGPNDEPTPTPSTPLETTKQIPPRPSAPVRPDNPRPARSCLPESPRALPTSLPFSRPPSPQLPDYAHRRPSIPTRLTLCIASRPNPGHGSPPQTDTPSLPGPEHLNATRPDDPSPGTSFPPGSRRLLDPEPDVPPRATSRQPDDPGRAIACLPRTTNRLLAGLLISSQPIATTQAGHPPRHRDSPRRSACTPALGRRANLGPAHALGCPYRLIPARPNPSAPFATLRQGSSRPSGCSPQPLDMAILLLRLPPRSLPTAPGISRPGPSHRRPPTGPSRPSRVCPARRFDGKSSHLGATRPDQPTRLLLLLSAPTKPPAARARHA